MSATVANAKLSYGSAVRSELLKVTTMRSMWWILIVSVAMGIFILATSSEPPPEPGVEAEWTAVTSAKGILTPWVILAVYAALQATGEWSSGMYRVSFAVVPRRNLWLAAKATALGIFAGAVSILVMITSVVTTLVKFGNVGATIDFAVGHTWQIFIGVPAVCIMTAIMAVGIGALVRSSGIAVTAVVGLLVVLPFAGLFGLQWLAHITAYLPSGAGDSIIGAGSFGVTPDDIGPWLGTVVLLAWSVGACIAASVAMSRRDA
ncbi:hypothetical protein [Demequina sp. NBRC 110056]|uniref:hypothetical protein n=1 Tax=Demequina sp. NBRC 110056 TaxID=1570345 RepID=UPI000A0460BE|nr:hypothetical protein [Demequina sp. NBRC 110056]